MSPHMTPEYRRVIILERLAAQRAITVAQLSGEFGISSLTVRRDLDRLAAQGELVRVHGGALVAPGTTRPSRPHSIGMVAPGVDYYWPEIVAAAQHEAAIRGARLHLRLSQDYGRDTLREARKLLETGRVSGLILSPLFNGHEDRAALEEWLARQSIPIMYAERQTRSMLPGVQSVMSDNAAGAELAARHLHELGHERMAIVVKPAAPGGVERLAAWRRVLAELDLPQFDHVESISWTDPSRDRLLRELLAWVRDEGITSLFVNVDTNALALLQSCHEQGVNVPGELSIVSYDDTMASLTSPMLTAVRPPRAAVGRMAVRYLMQAVALPNEHPTHRLMLLPQLVVRESTGPPRQRGRA